MMLLIYKILIAQVNFLSMSSAGMYRHDQLQRALHYTGLLLSHLLTKKYTFLLYEFLLTNISNPDDAYDSA